VRVLLLQPRPKTGLGFQSTICVEPLGLEVVAGALTNAHHQVKLLDLLEGELPVNAVKEFNPQAIGISCSFAVDTYRVLNLAEALRQINPKFFIFVGGHHVSLTPEVFFHPAIDALVIGEGETTTPELISALEGGQDLSQVRGLVLNHPEGQVFTGIRPLLTNLGPSTLPPP